MKSLISVIYASRATQEFHEHEIPDLLKQARLANAAHELTGMLLYIAGAFVQVLEGEAAMVEAVFETIRADKRHCQVALISSEPILERAFEGWTMSHKTLDPVEAGELIGEADYFLSPAWIQQLDSHRAKKLLSAAANSTRAWKMAPRATIPTPPQRQIPKTNSGPAAPLLGVISWARTRLSMSRMTSSSSAAASPA
jgi:hypothetical protein